MGLQEFQVKPIGFVERTSTNENVKDKNLVSRITLRKTLTKALDGIQDFSHVFVIFWLHMTPNIGKKVSNMTHPRGKAELPLMGIFATRTPNRPNPIGLTLVELIKREGNVLWVKGLDAFDGTPVLDIKPYDNWDVASSFRSPHWC